MSQQIRLQAQGNERVFRSLSYVLVFLLMACMVLTVSILIRQVLPEWHTGILAAAALFVALDRLYTYRQLKRLEPLSLEWAIALGTQWIVILLVTRLLLAYANGLAAFWEQLSLFARGYLEKFFTPELVVSLLLALAVWVLTRLFLDLIDETGFEQSAALSEEPVLVQSESVPAHQRLVNLVFTLGIVLVLLTAMTRMNLRTIVSTPGLLPKVEFSRFSGAEAGVLLYFVFGLALLSLSRLMSLQAHWNRMRIPISSGNLAKRWGLYSLFFLLGLAVIVAILPSGDSIGFFSLIGTLFTFLFGILLFITQLLIGLILLLFSLPFLLFDRPPPFLSQSDPLPPVLPPVDPLLPATPSEVWALIRSVLLWGGLLVIVIFALVQFLRQHGGLLPALRRTRLTGWLVLAWQWLTRSMDQTRGSLVRVLSAGWQSLAARLEGKRLLPPISLFSVRSLDPRRRIYFFYLALVRRGGEQGIVREPSETPGEYAVKLRQALPASTEDVDSLTEAFVQARYNPREVQAQEADAVKAAWERLRQALQRKRESDRSAGKSP